MASLPQCSPTANSEEDSGSNTSSASFQTAAAELAGLQTVIVDGWTAFGFTEVGEALPTDRPFTLSDLRFNFQTLTQREMAQQALAPQQVMAQEALAEMETQQGSESLPTQEGQAGQPAIEQESEPKSQGRPEPETRPEWLKETFEYTSDDEQRFLAKEEAAKNKKDYDRADIMIAAINDRCEEDVEGFLNMRITDKKATEHDLYMGEKDRDFLRRVMDQRQEDIPRVTEITVHSENMDTLFQTEQEARTRKADEKAKAEKRKAPAAAKVPRKKAKMSSSSPAVPPTHAGPATISTPTKKANASAVIDTTTVNKHNVMGDKNWAGATFNREALKKRVSRRMKDKATMPGHGQDMLKLHETKESIYAEALRWTNLQCEKTIIEGKDGQRYKDWVQKSSSLKPINYDKHAELPKEMMAHMEMWTNNIGNLDLPDIRMKEVVEVARQFMASLENQNAENKARNAIKKYSMSHPTKEDSEAEPESDEQPMDKGKDDVENSNSKDKGKEKA